MQVKFTDKAIEHLAKILDVFLEYAGERSALKFSKLVDDKIRKISDYPYIGFIEPLLSDRKYLFRATVIYGNYKMIYYVEDNVIWIAAFWDMRINPAKLQRMI